MADLVSVMLKSLGINGAEITDAANQMQSMIAKIYATMSRIEYQNNIIITHLAETSGRETAIAIESNHILTEVLTNGSLGK